MGYSMCQLNSSFKIKKENFQATALEILKNKVCFTNLIELNHLPTILDSLGWDTVIDPDSGDIIDINFVGENMHDEEDLFRIIAPFVEPGSFIQMNGGSIDFWEWRFDGKTCKEVPGKVVFEEEPEEE